MDNNRTEVKCQLYIFISSFDEDGKRSVDFKSQDTQINE